MKSFTGVKTKFTDKPICRLFNTWSGEFKKMYTQNAMPNCDCIYARNATSFMRCSDVINVTVIMRHHVGGIHDVTKMERKCGNVKILKQT